jgi:hypothetical protein
MTIADLPPDFLLKLVEEWMSVKSIFNLKSAMCNHVDLINFNKSVIVENKTLRNIHSGLLQMEITVSSAQSLKIFTFVPLQIRSIFRSSIKHYATQKSISTSSTVKCVNKDSFVKSGMSQCFGSGCSKISDNNHCSVYVDNFTNGAVATKWICVGFDRKLEMVAFCSDFFEESCSCGATFEHELTTHLTCYCSCFMDITWTFPQRTLNSLMLLLRAAHPLYFEYEYVAKFATRPIPQTTVHSPGGNSKHLAKVRFYLPANMNVSDGYPEYSAFLHTDHNNAQYYQTCMSLDSMSLHSFQNFLSDKTDFHILSTLHVSTAFLTNDINNFLSVSGLEREILSFAQRSKDVNALTAST